MTAALSHPATPPEKNGTAERSTYTSCKEAVAMKRSVISVPDAYNCFESFCTPLARHSLCFPSVHYCCSMLLLQPAAAPASSELSTS